MESSSEQADSRSGGRKRSIQQIAAETNDPAVLRQMIDQQCTAMARWKTSVKDQLQAAESKNKALREECDEATSKLAAVTAAARVELHREFKDRLVLKDEEIGRLLSELSVARNARQEAAEKHLQQLEQARQEAANEQAIALAQEKRAAAQAAAKHAEDVRILEDVVANKDHEISVLETRITTLERKLEDSAAAAVAAQAENTAAENAQLLSARRDIEAAHRERDVLRGALETAQKRAVDAEAAARMRYEALMQEEVQQRDEQIQVLQVLLRTARADVAALQHKANALEAQLEGDADERGGALSHAQQQLQETASQLAEAKHTNANLARENDKLKSKIEELEVERERREKAITELMFADDQAQIRASLEGQLQRLQSDATVAQRRVGELERALEQAQKEGVESRMAIEKEKEALATQRADIETRLIRLREQETRSREQLQRLVQQADRTLGERAAAAAAVASSIGSLRSHQSLSAGAGYSGYVAGAASTVVDIDDEGRPVYATGNIISDNFRRLRLWLVHKVGVIPAGPLPAPIASIRRGVSSALLNAYKRLTLAIIIVFFLSFFYWHSFSSASSFAIGEPGMVVSSAAEKGSIRTPDGDAQAMRVLQLEFNALAADYNLCCKSRKKIELLPLRDKTSVNITL